MGEMIKLYLAPSESGWAETLGGGLVRIANIPGDGDYNLGDVVTVHLDPETKQFLLISDLVKRKFPVRTKVIYLKDDDYRKLSRAMETVGGATEGMIGPSKKHPGFAGVAALKEEDVIQVLDELGLEQPPDWVPNELA